MIPKIIKQLAARLRHTYRHSTGRLRNAPKLILRAATATCLRVGDKLEKADTQGEFNLPRALRPFFYPTLWATLLAITPIVYLWVDASLQEGHTFRQIVVEGGKIAPGFIAGAIGAALLLTLPVYGLTGGIAMLGILFRNLEERTRKSEKDRIIEEQAQALEQKQEALEQKDRTITELLEKLGQSGLDPDA